MKRLSPKSRQLLAERIEQYHANVALGPAGDYLAKRKILGAADRFMLGYSGDTDKRYLANRLTIPYLSPAGPWFIKYRCIEHRKCEGHPKYTYEGGEEHQLYNAGILRTARRLVVVEGEIDAITWELIGVPAVGFPGVKSWQDNPHWPLCFENVEEAIIVADGDDAGRQAAKEIMRDLREYVGGPVRLVFMPDGADTNSYYRKRGAEALRAKVNW